MELILKMADGGRIEYNDVHQVCGDQWGGLVVIFPPDSKHRAIFRGDILRGEKETRWT